MIQSTASQEVQVINPNDTTTTTTTTTATTFINLKEQQQQQSFQINDSSSLCSITNNDISSGTKELDITMFIGIKVKWNGKEFNLQVNKQSSIGDLKQQLEGLTNVLSKRQKILGLVKGALPLDETILDTLNISSSSTIIMMGTPEANIIQSVPLSTIIDGNVFNDLDFDYIPDSTEIVDMEKNKNRLRRTKEKAEIAIINPPRTNKKLLVLDLDHTILDFKDQDVANMKRPYLDEFLTTSYEHYDIAIWSQTSWKWIEIKLTELGLLTNPNFKIHFVLDQTLMFKVTTYRAAGGKERAKIKHQVKALDIIWSHKLLGQFYTPKNTLHVDDLSKNFAMNPKNGVHIPAFKRTQQKQPDNVLYFLTKYLKSVALETDVTTINHNEWVRKV